MSRLEAPSEPSMEEILAQIRKIIADEPLQARAEHAQIAAHRRSQAPRPQQFSPTPSEPPHQVPAPALEAIARLESVLNAPLPHPEDDLSDLVEPPVEDSLALPQELPVALKPTDAIEHEAAVESIVETATAAPVIADAAVEPVVQAQSEAAPISPPVSMIASEPKIAPVPVAEGPANVEPVADAMETALDTLAAGLASVSAKSGQDSPIATPAEPSPVSPAADLPVAAEVAPALVAAEEPSPAAIEAVAPVVEAPATPQLEIQDTSLADSIEPQSAVAPADPEPTLPAADEAPAPVAVDAAPTPAIEAEQPVAESHDVHPPIVAEIPPELPEAAYAAAKISAASPPAAEATAPVNPAVPDSEDPSSTLDDTMADLLRPMLRQWLDENMPRIVERALRVEMAQMRKPKK